MDRGLEGAPPATYAVQMARVQQLVNELSKCDDVDRAVELFEEASALLEKCEARIEEAQGRLSRVTDDDERLPS